MRGGKPQPNEFLAYDISSPPLQMRLKATLSHPIRRLTYTWRRKDKFNRHFSVKIASVLQSLSLMNSWRITFYRHLFKCGSKPLVSISFVALHVCALWKMQISRHFLWKFLPIRISNWAELVKTLISSWATSRSLQYSTAMWIWTMYYVVELEYVVRRRSGPCTVA